MKQISTPIKIIGHLFFIVLFSFSFLFFKERHAFDTAHYLFEIITRKSFFIAHGRLIGFVSQVLPLIGVYVHASLKSLMLLYSFGDVLYYYVLFLIAAHVLKSTQASISILLIVCLAVKFSFYCPVTELLQGMALLPLLYEALLRINRFQYHLVPFMLVLIIFSHPLLFILVGFVIALFILHQKTNWFTKQNLLLLSTFAIITAAKFLLLDKYDYQKSFYPVVFKDYSHFNNITDTNFIFALVSSYFKENFIVCLFWILTLLLLLKNGKGKQAAFAFIAPLSFFVLIVVTHGFTGISNYSERMLLPFAGMIIIPFSLSFQNIQSVLSKQIFMLIITVTLCFRLWIIYDTSFIYTKRVAQMEELIHQAHLQNNSKCIVDERNLLYLPYAMTGWSYPIETLLLSSIISKDSSVTIAQREEHYNRFAKRDLKSNELYKTQDSIISYNSLNKNYFHFKESPYTFLNTVCDLSEERNSAVRISFTGEKLIKSVEGVCYLPITLTNNGNRKCSSSNNGYKLLLNAIFLKDSAYRDEEAIPFQTDLVTTLKQDLCFKNYDKPGEWKISVSVLDEKNKLAVKPFTINVNVK